MATKKRKPAATKAGDKITADDVERARKAYAAASDAYATSVADGSGWDERSKLRADYDAKRDAFLDAQRRFAG